MWNNDEPLSNLGINIPEWISPGFSPYDAIAVAEGGCASGAYMPAVTYHQALETMSEHGNDVLEYIEEKLGAIPQPEAGESWDGIAVFYLSVAVELFASLVVSELEDIWFDGE